MKWQNGFTCGKEVKEMSNCNMIYERDDIRLMRERVRHYTLLIVLFVSVPINLPLIC